MRLPTNDAQVECAATEVEDQGRSGTRVGRVRRGDRLGDEIDLAKTSQCGRRTKPRRRALVRALGADEADRTAKRDRFGRHTGELSRPRAHVREDQRDQLLEALRAPEYVGSRLERVAEEGLQRLEQAARRVGVRVDVRFDARLGGIGRCDSHAKHLKFPGERTPGAVVFEVRVNGRPADDG